MLIVRRQWRPVPEGKSRTRLLGENARAMPMTRFRTEIIGLVPQFRSKEIPQTRSKERVCGLGSGDVGAQKNRVVVGWGRFPPRGSIENKMFRVRKFAATYVRMNLFI